MLVNKEILNFRGLWGCVSRTLVRVYNNQGRWAVIATEVEGNPGTSVTNAWGGPVDLAFQLLRLLPAGVDRNQIIWIEHYPERRSSSESYDRVYMNWDADKNCYRMSMDTSAWRRLKAEELKTILGEEA
jgi:hypothetical protein